MRFLSNCDFTKLTPQLLAGLYVLDHITTEVVGIDCTITFLADGKHSAKSLHPKGNAADIRIKDFDGNFLDISGKDRALALEIIKRFKERMPAAFQIILESNHIHLEYDPD